MDFLLNNTRHYFYIQCNIVYLLQVFVCNLYNYHDILYTYLFLLGDILHLIHFRYNNYSYHHQYEQNLLYTHHNYDLCHFLIGNISHKFYNNRHILVFPLYHQFDQYNKDHFLRYLKANINWSFYNRHNHPDNNMCLLLGLF